MTLDKGFSPGGDSASQGHLAVPKDIFDCQLGVEVPQAFMARGQV